MNVESEAVSYCSITNHLKTYGFKTTTYYLWLHSLAGSSTDLGQLDFGWAQSCVRWQVNWELSGLWKLEWLISAPHGLTWSMPLIQACCHGDHREAKEEAEARTASWLRPVTILQCTGQSKPQRQPKLEGQGLQSYQTVWIQRRH